MITLVPQIYLNLETISEAYSETYDEICNEHNDDSLEGLLSCDLFSKEDDYDHEERYSQGCDTTEEDSLISDIDGEMTIGIL